MRVCDSSHERLLAHVAGRLLHQTLLVGAVELLGELHGLQRRQAACHAVDHRHRLRLRCVQACDEEKKKPSVRLSHEGTSYRIFRIRGLTLGYRHDSGQRHDEVLRLLVAVMGTVDVGQRADWRKASARARNLSRDTRESNSRVSVSICYVNPHNCIFQIKQMLAVNPTVINAECVQILLYDT